MQTITFYSYKGGVGRTLALANVAKWLSEFKKTVCLIDFDLEAPGLHYKFQSQLADFEFNRGIVDYIHDFVSTKEVPPTILDCVHTIELNSLNPHLHFIPAGNVSNSDYWKKLSAINWNDLFYREDSEGVPFFLDLKEKIKTEINPDFLLIDSRTGISEISGITMSLYADKIIIVAANNDENILGAKEVIKSISNPENNFFDIQPEIIFVLSRIPYPENVQERSREQKIVNAAKRKLSFKQEDKILLIHSDRELEIQESLKISSKQRNENRITSTIEGYKKIEIPIAEDYLALFDRLTQNILSTEEIKRFNDIKQAESFAEEAEEKNSINDKIELLSKAIKLNPNDDYYYKRGLAYAQKAELQSSMNDFNKGLVLNNNNFELYYSRGVLYGKLENYPEAINDFNKAVNLNKNFLMAYLALGRVFRDKNEIENALYYFNKCLTIDVNESGAYNEIADIYRKQNNYEAAFKNAYKAIETSSRNAIAYATLAEIHYCTGNLSEFYLNLELALMFDFPSTDFTKDKFYDPIRQEERFQKLLEKYGYKGVLDKKNIL